MNDLVYLFWGFVGGIIATVVFIVGYYFIKVNKVLKESEQFNKLS